MVASLSLAGGRTIHTLIRSFERIIVRSTNKRASMAHFLVLVRNLLDVGFGENGMCCAIVG